MLGYEYSTVFFMLHVIMKRKWKEVLFLLCSLILPLMVHGQRAFREDEMPPYANIKYSHA